MKRVIGYSLTGLAAYVGFLVYTVPAEQALAMARDQLRGVYLQGVNGTVWNGRANRVQFQDQVFERLRWSIHFLPILWGRVEFDVSFKGGGREGSGVVSLGTDGSVSLSDVQASLPVADVDQYAKMIPVDLGGMLDLQLDHLDMVGGIVTSAAGTAHWREASVTAPIAQALGGYTLSLSDDDQGVKGVVKDDGGPVQLEGVARLNADGTYKINASLAARGDQKSMLAQGIQALGRPGADGRVPVEFSGSYKLQ